MCGGVFLWFSWALVAWGWKAVWIGLRGPTHVRVLFRSPSMASVSLLFACPKRSNQEKGHPRGRDRRASCPATARGRSGGSLTAHPCADSERARIVRAPLWAFSSAPSPRPRGNPERAKRGRPGRRSRGMTSESLRARRPVKARTQRLLLLTWVPLCRGEGRTHQVRACAGRREGSRRFCRSPWMDCRQNPGCPQRILREAKGAVPRVCSLWLLSLAQALRRRSGANGEAGPEGAQGRMPAVTESNSVAMDGGRNNTGT